MNPLMESLEIVPFKPLAAENPSFIWNVKCTFIACDEEDDTFCKLDDACASRYDIIKGSSNNQRRKRRSGNGKLQIFTVEQKVEHPCAYASDHRSICDGNGENCWTEDVCKQAYSSELKPKADVITDVIAHTSTPSPEGEISDDVTTASDDVSTASDNVTTASSAISSFSSALVMSLSFGHVSSALVMSLFAK